MRIEIAKTSLISRDRPLFQQWSLHNDSGVEMALLQAFKLRDQTHVSADLVGDTRNVCQVPDKSPTLECMIMQHSWWRVNFRMFSSCY
ncbi:MAG: hypothetical protein DWQ41_25365 [Planctomycetota bacterium]|nr:MAG: hypothetical protein DWQ41_25365 [Planctomycetota bacterium]